MTEKKLGVPSGITVTFKDGKSYELFMVQKEDLGDITQYYFETENEHVFQVSISVPTENDTINLTW
jgi:hypothetical protein